MDWNPLSPACRQAMDRQPSRPEIVSGLAYVNLRGHPENAEFVAAAPTGEQELPLSVNRLVNLHSHRVFWLGPGEWLIVSAAGQDFRCLAEIAQTDLSLHGLAVRGHGHQRRTSLPEAARRECARYVLAKGCTLDLHHDTRSNPATARKAVWPKRMC